MSKMDSTEDMFLPYTMNKKQSSESEILEEQGRATQNQLRIWEALLGARIRLQKALVEANKLPQTDGFKSIVNCSSSLPLALSEEKSEEFSCVPAVEMCQLSLILLVDNLLELQDVLLKCNNQESTIFQGKRRLQQSDSVQGQLEDEKVSISEDENDNGITSQDTPKAKRFKKSEDYEEEITLRYNSFKDYREQTIQKWNARTQVATGKLAIKIFASFQISVLNQIDQILADRERLAKRTQLKRSQYDIIGNVVGKVCIDDDNQINSYSEPKSSVSTDSNYDKEIFDDDDFYHQLLRELIDRKTSNVTDPIELSRHWLQLKKFRSKMGRKVDLKASKARKIRYDVHPKLVNFVAPHDMSLMTAHAVNELFNSLFGSH